MNENTEKVISNLNELLLKQEDLHPDLKSHIYKEGSLGDCLKHPLVFELFYHPGMNALINKRYLAKKEYIEKCLDSERYDSYIWLFERPYRIEEFLKIQNRLSDIDYWKIFGSIWTDSENIWQYKNYVQRILNSSRPNKEELMNDEEKVFLKNLPDKVTIFRGHQNINKLGYSWTLSYWKAKWFSERLNKRQTGVIQTTIDKSEIIAVFLGRGELEVVVDFNKINKEKIKSFKKPRLPLWIEEVKKEIEDNFALNKRRTLHGIWHWEKVERNAAYLAKNTKGADKLVAQLFSYIHDSKRITEEEDPNHGQRAAEFAKKLFKEGKLEISQKQLTLLIEACKNHEKGKTSEDPTIGVCWDADRLDLTRDSVIPDFDLLSTQAAKDIVWQI